MTDLAIIDPAQAKAFDIRRYAIGVRTRISDIDDIDALGELAATMQACRHRLRSLHEEVVQADRTALLIMARVGQLLSGYERNDGTRLRQRNTASYRAKARLIAQHPDIVEQALAQPSVSVSGVVRRIQALRAAEEEKRFLEELPDQIKKMGVIPGEWIHAGHHLIYCGPWSADDFFFDAPIKNAERPRLTYVDMTDRIEDLVAFDFFVTNGWGEVHAITCVPDRIALLPSGQFYPHTQTLAFIADRPGGGGARFLPTVVTQRDSSYRGRLPDVLRLRPKPSSVHDGLVPITLVAKLIELTTRPGEVVFTPSLGPAGLVLLACEQTKRYCIAAEPDPTNVVAALVRAGLEPRRI
jgi:hypothetical protein